MKLPLLECSFLIPVRRDAILSNGEGHEPELWEWLDDEMMDRFGGATYSPLLYRGAYIDRDTGERVADDSKKCTVAVDASCIDELRQILSAACVFFEQKCIYLSVAGHVEFIEPPTP